MPGAAENKGYSLPKRIVFVAAAVLVDEAGRILLAQRPEGKSFAGFWEFPGGKIDTDERPEQALVRELHEELDILVDPDDCLPLTFASHDYVDFHLFMPVFVCRRWSGTMRSREGQNLSWVTGQDLGAFSMPPADLALLPVLKKLL